jgi:catalase
MQCYLEVRKVQWVCVALAEQFYLVLEAYKHGKTICALNEGSQLLTTLGFSTDKTIDSPLYQHLSNTGRHTALEDKYQEYFQTEIAFHRHGIGLI